MENFNVILYSPKELEDYELFKDKCNKILERKLKNPEIKLNLLTGDNNELAKKYAKEKELNLTIIPADWKTHGKLAGIKRNQRLVELGNACILFMGKEGGENKGIDDLRKKAEKEKLMIRLIKV